MSHTYALLEVTPAVYAEIEKRLREAGYGHAFNECGEIDMHGIALVKGPDLDPQPVRAAGVHCVTCQCNKIHPTPPVPENPRSRSWHENALTERPKS